MKIKTISIVLGMLLLLLSVKAQTIKPLSIGNTLPDLLLHNVINYKDSVIRLSNLKSKGIVLDFFSTYCGSCIEYLPRMDSLQKRLEDSLRILVVCYESKEKIQKFLSRQRLSRYRHLAFVTADSVLQRLFPHDIFPHEVWIDGHRKVSNTTDALSVNHAHVSQWLKTGVTTVYTKVDRLDYDRKKSILTLGNPPIVSQRVLTRNIPGIPSASGIVKDTTNHTKRMYYHNLPLEHLLKAALSFTYTNRTVWKTTCDQRKPSSVISQNYCYEISLPDTSSDDQYKKYMLDDICRSIGIDVHIDTMETPCYRLTDMADHKKSTDKPYVHRTEDPKEGSYVVYRNWEVGKLVQYLDYYSSVPVIDGTPKDCRVSLKVHTDLLKNYEALRDELKTQGWDLEPISAKLAVMVIRNTN